MTASRALFRPTLLRVSIVAGLMVGTQAAAADGLETIVITAPAAASPAEPLALTAEDSAPRADLAEVLREINGVTSGRMSGHGLDPIIRGQREHQLNVFLDGAAIANACPNRMDPPTSFGNLAGYDAVEVRKGVTTLTRGPGGSGGSIELTRNTFERAAEAGIQSRFGFATSNNGLTDQSSADALFSNGNAYGRVIGQIANGENYEDGDGNEVPSSFKQRSGTIIGGYRVSDETGIEVSVDRNRMLDTRYAGTGMDSIYDNATIYRLDGRLGDLEGPVDALRVELSRANVDHLMDNYSLRALNAPMPMEAPAESHTTTTRLTATSRIDAVEIDYGLDFERVRQDAQAINAMNDMLMFRQWPDGQTDQLGAFIESDWRLTGDDSLRAGMRVDRFESEIDADLEKSIATHMMVPASIRTSAADPKSDTEVSGLLRYDHAFDAHLNGHVGVSRTAVAPNLTQKYITLLMNGMLAKVGNPDLEPEIHHQLEAGLSWQRERLATSATVYVDQVDDYILQDRQIAGLMPMTTSYRNVDARLFGGEFDLRYGLTDWLAAEGQISYVRGRNTSDSRDLPQIPPLSGTLGLSAERGAIDGAVVLRWADGAEAIDEQSGLDTTETGGYAVLDLTAGYDITGNWRVEAGVDNVFDRTYAQHVNRAYSSVFGDPTARINEPGRTVWARLTATF
ncbi:TonB-dependent receptor [Guyparkeria hydrothermalis]|uniref:TonB-dependent receptor domain-containing protein n=1 Tax=Guyparkeria hydrothermalis TaxID=923 RepID=UPI00202115C5|nr:TonB-dependent receptor [Guyparkeria hydrothermalis]MCL7744076.1 TonB-dependent receptor [Guyparkeria hydrothermalis]